MGCDSNENHFLNCLICDDSKSSSNTTSEEIEKLLQTPIKDSTSKKPMIFAAEYQKSPVINEVIRSLLPRKFKNEDTHSFFSKKPATNPEPDNANNNFAHRGKIKQ